MAKYSGKKGRLMIGAQAVNITDWEVDDKVSLPESTDSTSGEGTNRIVGRQDWSVSFKGWYDDASNPVELAIGTEGVFKLELNTTTAKFLQGTAIIESMKTAVDVMGAGTVGYTGSASANGVLTRSQL